MHSQCASGCARRHEGVIGLHSRMNHEQLPPLMSLRDPSGQMGPPRKKNGQERLGSTPSVWRVGVPLEVQVEVEPGPQWSVHPFGVS